MLNTITPATAKTWIFEEDRAVLEAQQQAIDARPGQALRNLNIDAGSLWARRLIDGMLAREREPYRAEQS